MAGDSDRDLLERMKEAERSAATIGKRKLLPLFLEAIKEIKRLRAAYDWLQQLYLGLGLSIPEEAKDGE